MVVRESGIKEYIDLLQGPVLYLSTMFLGLLLGVLCDANTIMDPKILPCCYWEFWRLLLSGIGGILAGYVLYFISGGKYNPAIGIAGVSCVPTTAKVAQKLVAKANRTVIIYRMLWREHKRRDHHGHHRRHILQFTGQIKGRLKMNGWKAAFITYVLTIIIAFGIAFLMYAMVALLEKISRKKETVIPIKPAWVLTGSPNRYYALKSDVISVLFSVKGRCI